MDRMSEFSCLALNEVQTVNEDQSDGPSVSLCLFSADPSGWWYGRLRGREGMFPGNYVEKI